MTEENEKLKIELKDLKQLLELKSQVQKIDTNTTNEIIEPEVQNLPIKTKTMKEDENPWKKVSYRVKKRQLPAVNQEPKITEEKEYNCTGCDFQGTTENILEKHIKVKHMITCRICDESFQSKPSLMLHRKQKHADFVATCRNFKENKCQFTDLKCWWSHRLKQTVSEEVKCFICDEKFENKTNMMLHRKKEHPEKVRQCVKYNENECRFQAESCWFKHEPVKQTDVKSSEQLVFHKVPGNLKPPITTQNSVPIKI